MQETHEGFSACESLLRRGDLEACIEGLRAALRKDASNLPLRVFLAQAYCVAGDWDRALMQLKALAELDAANVAFARTCETAIRCERDRAEVFSGAQRPLVLGEPEPWLGSLVHANTLLAEGRTGEAASQRAVALESVTLSSGSANGDRFGCIVDLDSRLGPVFEMFINGNYYWVPIARVRRIQIEQPANLQEFVWLPVNVTWTNEGTAFALMPVRYPGTETHADPAFKLARHTEWGEIGDDTFLGQGQRMFGTDSSEIALLDLRELVIDPLGNDVSNS